MKIICAATSSAGINSPVIFLKPDTAYLKNNRPFFIPDFSSDVRYKVGIAILINRLGKNIARRFAHRYYCEITAGVAMTAHDLQPAGLPSAVSASFDSSAAIGDFVSLDELGADVSAIDFHLDRDGKTVQTGNTQHLRFSADEIIEYASRYFTLRTGDIIFIESDTADSVRAAIGNQLQGYISDRKVLELRIK
ncbi:MAG: fumarylacetoacetate hydrolase family protein [Dysgonamonadaceae bacterium]|jgi:2-keto-4-pentenoate hydratase/2-oxohepta-3-ene-1,7-dioic acid hydratase in catechol pathway|nr:fumarylacetoacetate hydrolase family protein [Dysgonamonadaceae bacterium]